MNKCAAGRSAIAKVVAGGEGRADGECQPDSAEPSPSSEPQGGNLRHKETRMIRPAQSTKAAEPAEAGAMSDSTPPAQNSGSPRRRPRGFAVSDGRRGIDWLAWAVGAGLVIIWMLAFSGWAAGSKADWFLGASAFSAVMVAMWQTLTIQRQAKQDAAEAAERLRKELAAAEARSAQELEHTRQLHLAERERYLAELERCRVEMEAHRELARVHHTHLLAQQQKQATIDVSRAVSAHAHMLAALWNEGANILRIEDRDEREQAMNPIFEQIGQVVNDFSVEIANAHLLVEDDRMHAALDRVNDAVLMAIGVAEDVHVAVVEGRTPDPNPIPPVQLLMNKRAAEARHLAWDLLRAGLGKA
jgi:hypothetical protein